VGSFLKHCIGILKKLGLYIKKHNVSLLAFFLPALILEIAYVANGIFPFGNRDILIIDLYHQYAPFISDLKDKLSSFSSLLYSWSGGLGINYLPLYAYYLASPLNLIVLLFPREYLTEAVLVLTLLKVGLSGVFFSYYLRGVHGEKNLTTVTFSILYALSGYVMAFSWNIMWLDSIYLLPLIMLGLVKLVRDGNGYFYCITLALALLWNFYMAFFICFFIIFYYPVCLFQYHSIKKPATLVKKTAQLAGFSLLSAGLSSILLLPTYFQLKSTSASGDVFPKTLENAFDLFDFITRHFTAAAPLIREGAPNLYSGILVLILIPIYFLSRSIPLKEKLWKLSLLLFLILSLNMNMLNFIWHGFHYPNQLPHRFAFVYIFLVVSMSYEAFRNLKEFSGKQIGTICFWILGILIISQKFEDLSIEYLTIYVSAAFIILYAAALAINLNSGSTHFKKALVMFLIVTLEITTNTVLSSFDISSTEGYSSRDKYASGKEVALIRQQLDDIDSKDKGFYRLEIFPSETTNDPALYNYPGLSVFSSTISEKPVRLLNNLGYYSNEINSYRYEGSTVLLDSLLGIKYLIYRNFDIEEKLYTNISSQGGIRTFENPYALPLGFYTNKNFNKFTSSSGTNPLNNQKLLMEALTGEKNILIPLDESQGAQSNLEFISASAKYYSYKRTDKDSNSTARLQLTVDKPQQVYLYYKAPSDMKGSGFIKINDKKLDFNPKHSSIINVGFCEPETLVELNINFDKESSETGSFELYPYALDLAAFEKAIALVRDNSMTVESFTATNIKGQVSAEEDGLMVMSIPYDKGWQVIIDNKKAVTQEIDECLLSFELPKGTHSLELRFFPDKLLEGIVVSIASFIILIGLLTRRFGISFSISKVIKKGDK
jgi:uncharacterized membrane protein YfhO